MACGILVPPPGIGPTSPALEGGFLTTGPPGKSQESLLVHWVILFYFILFSSTSLLLPTHLPPPSCTHAQSCSPMDCSPPGSSVHGLFQAGILEWVAISFSTLGDFKAWELRPPGPSAHWHLADTSPSYCTFFLPVLSLWLDKL